MCNLATKFCFCSFPKHHGVSLLMVSTDIKLVHGISLDKSCLFHGIQAKPCLPTTMLAC